MQTLVGPITNPIRLCRAKTLPPTLALAFCLKLGKSFVLSTPLKCFIMAFTAPIPQVANVVGQNSATPQDRANRLARRNALARMGANGGSYVSSLPAGTVVQGQILPHGQAIPINGRTITYKPFIFDDGSEDVFVAIPSKSTKGATNCVLAIGYTDPQTGIDSVAFILPPDMTAQQIAGLTTNAVVSIEVGPYGEGRETGLWKLS